MNNYKVRCPVVLDQNTSKLVNTVVKTFDNPNLTVNIDDVLEYTSTMSELLAQEEE